MKIYLDICSFNRPFDDQSQLRIHLESEAKLAIQYQIREGFHQLIWSYMMDYENQANPYEERKIRIAEWKSLASEHILADDEILTHARAFQSLGVKTKDSLHLACATVAKADLFLTTDDGLLKKRAKIPDGPRILNPVDYITQPPHGDTP